ncbi:hypothetical protein MMC13_005390 [Lambiella insularis]|nr:hypothetical protein [Lambiella insularis]
MSSSIQSMDVLAQEAPATYQKAHDYTNQCVMFELLKTMENGNAAYPTKLLDCVEIQGADDLFNWATAEANAQSYLREGWLPSPTSMSPRMFVIVAPAYDVMRVYGYDSANERLVESDGALLRITDGEVQQMAFPTIRTRYLPMEGNRVRRDPLFVLLPVRTFQLKRRLVVGAPTSHSWRLLIEREDELGLSRNVHRWWWNNWFYPKESVGFMHPPQLLEQMVEQSGWTVDESGWAPGANP